MPLKNNEVTANYTVYSQILPTEQIKIVRFDFMFDYMLSVI